MFSLKQNILALPPAVFCRGEISIRPIKDDYDLWYAVVECQLDAGQTDFVNPAGFSIGRAYLAPENNIPCIIWLNDTRIGYIVFRTWSGEPATSWSYYLDRAYQGKGFGKIAAQLAVQILRTAAPELPIKLSTEANNEKAQRLYRSIGFRHYGEMDGDDLVFEYKEVI